MGQLALAVVGGVVGSMFGMPQLGFMVGSLVGSYLFAPSGTHTEGPRLQDLQTTGATYGSPIAFGIGTARVGGNIIWSPGLEEHEEEESSGGKGGGGGSSVTTYTYSASFAVALAEGPIDRVLRIWGDGKLIYDSTGSGDVVELDGMRWVFYPGDENQLPSPVIEAHEGAGQVPAHRGLCYIVFENMPLANFGNRIPTMTAEITKDAVRTMPITQTPDFNEHFFSTDVSDLPDYGDVDIDRSRIYLAWPANNARADGRLVVMDANSMAVTNSLPLADLMTTLNPVGELLTVGSRGNLIAIFYVESSGSGPLNRMVTINKDTLATNWVFPAHVRYQPAWKGRNCGFIKPGVWDELVFYPQAISGGSGGGTLWVSDATNAFSYEWAGWTDVFSKTGGFVTKAADWGRPEVEIFSAQVYTTDLFIDVGTFFASQILADNMNEVPTDARSTMPHPRKWQFPAATFGFSSMDVCLPYFDEMDGNYTMILSGTGGVSKVVKFHPDVGIISIKPTSMTAVGSGSVGDNGTSYKQRVQGYAYVRVSTGSGETNMVRVDFRTGETDLVPLPAGFSSAGVWSEVNFTAAGRAVAWTLLNPSAGSTYNRYCKLYLDRWAANGEVPIAPFIQYVSERVGLTAADIDVTDVDDTVFGYYVVRATAAKQVLAPLASACQFDAVESDYKMKFFHRGKPSSVSITQAELQPRGDEGQILEENRAQELELPSRVLIRYPDQDNAYGVGSQSDTRPSVPFRTMQSDGYNTVETPIIMNATRAKRLAQMTLYTAWQERSSYKYQPDPKYAYLDPTDTLDLTMADGTSYHQRIVKMVIGADLNVDVEAIGEDGATYVSDAQGDGGKPPQFEIPQVFSSALVLLDVPYLRDQDVNSVRPVLYGKISGYGNPGWRGAIAFKALTTDDTYTPQFTETDQSTQGYVTSVLPPTSSPWATDNETVMQVVMTSGIDRLASVTQEAMLNWANAAAVSAPNGEWEIIQYRDVTVIDEKTVELRGILRGRRGTDPFTDGHKSGDLIIFMMLNETNVVEFPTAEIASPRNWKAVSSGQYIERTPVVTYTPRGNSLRPYAPVFVNVAPSGADWNITWVRRTRFGGELLDGIGTVPLNETTESYEIDIINNGVVVRTLTSSTPSVIYTAAEVEADNTGAGFSVIVYQMSEVIGRGFPSKPASSPSQVMVNQVSILVLAALTESVDMQVNQQTVLTLQTSSTMPPEVNELTVLVLKE